MALNLLSFEGFDQYVDDADLQAAYSPNMSTYGVLNTGDTPFGYGKCLEVTNDAARRGYFPSLKKTDARNKVHYVSGRFKSNPTLLTGANATETTIFGIHIDGSASVNNFNFIGVYYNSVGAQARVCFQGWTYDPLSVDISDDVWHTYEILFYQVNASTGWAQVYIDDVLEWYGSGQDTDYNGLQFNNMVGGFGTQGRYDDIIYGWDDVDTSYPGDGTHWPSKPGSGDLVVYPVAPDGDNGTNQMTPSAGSDHYAMVDDSTPDDGTTKLTATGTGETEEFTLAALPANISSIYAVFGRMRARAETTQTISEALTLFTKSGVSSTDHAAFRLTGDTWQWTTWKDISIDPATAALWTVSNFNANAVVGCKT